MGTAVNEIPVGYTHSLASAHAERVSKDNRMPAGVKPASFYQRLVKHFYDRRAPHLFFWNTVCENYHQKLWTKEGDRDILDEVRSGDVYALIHTIEAMVFNRRPKLFLEGWHGRIQSDSVPTLEQMLNAEWYKDYRLVKEVRLAIRDCIKTGWGAVITTYDADFDPAAQGEAADKDREIAAENPYAASAMNEAGDQAAKIGGQLPGPEYHETFEADSRVLRDQINTRRVSAFDILMDPTATCVEDAKWVGRRILKTLESVQADDLLQNTSGLKPTSEQQESSRGRRKKSEDTQDPYDYVELYEIWERMVGGGWRYILCAKDHPDLLRVVENQYYIGCPLRIIKWNDDGEECFAQSDVLPAWPIILARRILLTKALDGYSREHLDKTFFDANMGLSEDQLKGIGDPQTGTYVAVKGLNTGQTLANSFWKPQKDAKSPEVMNMLAMFEREYQLASGIGANQQGQALKSATSATEANEIASFARARGEHKFGGAEEFVAGIAYDRLGMMWQFYDKSRVASIAGLEASKAWPQDRTADDVRSNLYVRVDPGSLRPQDDNLRSSQLIQALQIIGQIPEAKMMVNMPLLLREVFRTLGFQEGNKIIYTAEQVAQMMQVQAILAQMQAGQQQAAGGGEEPGQEGGSPDGPAETPSTGGQAQQASRGRSQGGMAA